jgi:short-subunit dehydrogenase
MSTLSTRYGPWALVTGASSGIGREMALRLAARGLHLVLVARSEDALASLAAEVTEQHRVQTRVVPLDLALPNATARLDAATADLAIGLVVLNAGFATSGSFLAGDAAREAEMVALNCTAVLEGSLFFGRRLAARKGGALVLVGSILGFQGAPYAAGYAATKSFVQSLGEGLAVELASSGVDVLTLAPGPTHTGFAARAGMKMGMAMGAAEVADAAVAAIGKRGTSFPGWLAKLLRFATGTVPRWVATRIFGHVMAGMAGVAGVAV